MILEIFTSVRRARGRFLGEIDMEIGDSSALNNFETDDSVNMGEFIAQIGGEWGGVVERMDNSSTKRYTGHTWRGLLNQWIIKPPDGESHLTVSGDLNDIIRTVSADVLGGFFDVSKEACGVTARAYSFARYCTVLDGLMKLCADHGCKLVIKNGIEGKKLKVVLSAERISKKTLSKTAYEATTTVSHMGINHLVCAGEGQNEERLVADLYLHPDGSVRETPYYTGFHERQAFYEHTSQGERSGLISEGTKKLKELASFKKMELKELYADAEIGDYLLAKKDGLVIDQPVVRRILTGSGGNYDIESKMKGDSE